MQVVQENNDGKCDCLHRCFLRRSGNLLHHKRVSLGRLLRDLVADFFYRYQHDKSKTRGNRNGQFNLIAFSMVARRDHYSSSLGNLTYFDSFSGIVCNVIDIDERTHNTIELEVRGHQDSSQNR